ncbi:hypothetical protein V6N11_043332 [Hibiscus sabdariffa]|uniref:DUF659 domain-containing protein n=2 Tax=Hibiscus sabdariffa TaxID=183260 RepID=A0ABR1Z772_9ROSI
MVEHKQSSPEPPTTQDLSLVIHGVGTDYMEAKEMNPGEALMFNEMFLTNGKEVSTQIPVLDQVDASTILQKSFIRNESIPQYILHNRQESYEQLEMDGIHVPRFLKVFELKNVHMSVRRFLFDIGATLDAVNSVYFQPMGDAIISGRNMLFMPPCNDLQGWILKKSMEMVKSDDEKLITSCVRISCYNLANRWNIQPCRILLHFLVYCAKGVLSKSIYASTVINSSDDLYEILKQVVEEVRFKLGLQVITNCDEQCTRRRMYAFDNDTGELAATRSTTNFTTLTHMVDLRNNLQPMVTSHEWIDFPYLQKSRGRKFFFSSSVEKHVFWTDHKRNFSFFITDNALPGIEARKYVIEFVLHCIACHANKVLRTSKGLFYKAGMLTIEVTYSIFSKLNQNEACIRGSMREERKIWNGAKFISGKMVESALVIHGVYMDLSHDVRKLTVFGDDLMIYLLIGRPQFGQSKGRTKADEPVPSEK